MKHRAVGILSKINQDWCIAVRVSLGASALKGTCSLTYTVIFHIITFSSPHSFFRDTGANTYRTPNQGINLWLTKSDNMTVVYKTGRRAINLIVDRVLRMVVIMSIEGLPTTVDFAVFSW